MARLCKCARARNALALKQDPPASARAVQFLYTEMDRLRELATIIHSGRAVLFTGAGFSADAKDRTNQPLPGSRQMIGDLWRIVFGDDQPDDSTLADLYDVALVRAPARLKEYLSNRLRVGDSPLPRTYAAWFGAPWHRIYTLNVDDLETAVARQFALARPLVSVSANAPSRHHDRDHDRDRDRDAALEVVHLNGLVGDDPQQVTFSTMQYAARLCAPDHGYEQLIEDLRTRPFVFVGTTLDEVVLWKHVQLERQHDAEMPRRHSFLISTSLDRARQVLLDTHRIHWIRATAAEVAEQLLAQR